MCLDFYLFKKVPVALFLISCCIVKDNMSHIQKLCNVERIFYNESAFNFSDLFTRVTVTIDELGVSGQSRSQVPLMILYSCERV